MKLTQIDSLLLPDYPHLEKTDDCLFFGEYTSRAGYAHSEINQLINNFKKGVEKKGLPEWWYKNDAINRIVELFLNNSSFLEIGYTWIPIPSSKIESDVEHDDRLWQVLKGLKDKKQSLDIRKLIVAKKSRSSAHGSEKRPTISDHLGNWYIDTSKIQPKPDGVVIFDDVITTGCSFKAAQKLLHSHFPAVPIMGVFIGRRVIQNSLQASS